MQAREKLTRNRNRCLRVLLATISLMSINQLGQCDEVTDRLPQSTAAWVRLNQVAQWPAIYKNSKLRRFLMTEPFASFRDSVASIEEDGQLVEQIGLSVAELIEAAHGDVIVAVMPLKGDRFTTLLAVETKDVETAEQLQKLAGERFTQRGIQARTGSMDRLRVSIYKLSTSEVDRCFTRFGNWLLIADHTAAFARFATAQRRAPGLSDYAVFDRVTSLTRSNQSGGIHMLWYADPWRFGNDHLAYRLGFKAVRAVGGEMVFGVGNNLCSYRTAVVRSGALEQAAEMLAFKKSTSPELPEWYPDNAVSIRSINLDYEQLLRGYTIWFDQTHGEGDEGLFETVLDDIKLEPDGPRVDVRADILANLNGPLSVVELPSGEATAPVYAIPVSNASRVASAIGRLFRGDPDVKKLDIAGAVAWKYGDLTRGGSRAVLGPDLSDVTLCVAQEHLFVTRHQQALKAILAESNSYSESGETFNRIFDFANGKGIQAPFSYGASEGMGGFGKFYESLRSDTFTKPETKKPSLIESWLINGWQQVESSPMLSALMSTRRQLPEIKAIQPLIEGTVSAGKIERSGWSFLGRIELLDRP